MIAHVLLALASGVLIEALYALGVLFIGARRSLHAAVSSVLWGGAFLVGVNESFRSTWAAAAWCAGLGLGTVLGIRLEEHLRSPRTRQ